MMYCLVYLMLSMAYTITESTHKEFLFENFPDHILSLPLENSTQISTKVADKLDCVFSCTSSHPWCRSVNFKIQPENDGLHICELLSTDVFTKPNRLKPTQGFLHLSIKNKCMDLSPCQNNALCHPDYHNNDYHCVCSKVTKGRNCESFHSDCSKLYSAGVTASGVYPIDPDGQGSFQVYCDMKTAGGKWTVFQRHSNDSISFKKGWQAYKTGFGNLTGEFWLGLEKIHRLAKRQNVSLRIDLEDLGGTKKYALYSSFSIAPESDFYRMTISGYSGTAGDSIRVPSPNTAWNNNNRRFTTPDKDNDINPGGNCGHSGGWWYGWCTNSDLNGAKTWWTFNKALKNTKMKLK